MSILDTNTQMTNTNNNNTVTRVVNGNPLAGATIESLGDGQRKKITLENGATYIFNGYEIERVVNEDLIQKTSVANPENATVDFSNNVIEQQQPTAITTIKEHSASMQQTRQSSSSSNDVMRAFALVNQVGGNYDVSDDVKQNMISQDKVASPHGASSLANYNDVITAGDNNDSEAYRKQIIRHYELVQRIASAYG